MHRRVVWVLALAACTSNTPAPTDAGRDTPSADLPGDVPAEDGCVEVTAIHSVLPSSLVVAPGARADLLLRLARDRRRCAGEYAVEVLGDIGTAPSRVTVALDDASVGIPFTAAMSARAGEIRVRPVSALGDAGAAAVSIAVRVQRDEPAACGADASAALGVLRAGSSQRGALDGSSVAIDVPMNTADLPMEAITARCANPGFPQGYRPLGPAVIFGPGAGRISRDVTFTIPANAARVPARYAPHVEVSWTPPGPSARPRIVPVSDVHFESDGTSLSFRGYRLGTYQAVLRSDLGATVRRRVTYRGIYGISMGAVGTSMIGVRNLARFDLMAALGGAADHTTSGAYLQRYVFGGFCTAAERARLGDAACATTDLSRTPAPDDINLARQDFEHFFAPPGGGTGGTFDRRARFRGFRDIARMFGDPVLRADPSNAVLPIGVPSSELARSDADRCREPVVLGGPNAEVDARFYDDEYNPDGRFAAITFCDGGTLPGNVGAWDGNVGDYPVEITLAIDLNGNRRRDPGEPVVRNFSEPYRDLGPDGLSSAMEPGYDPTTNPDPAGDDYDRVYNPGGTEGNHDRDEGESFDDVGLDGVPCPEGRRCPFDAGEGNGRYDTATGEGAVTRRNNPRTLLANAPREEVLRVAQWLDGGLRDALQFGLNANHYAGVLAQRDTHLRVVDGFSSIAGTSASSAEGERAFRPEDIDWPALPARTLLRYGSLDATPEEIRDGDGAHVGTNGQIANRLLASLLWASSRWPGGDRRFEPFTPSSDNAGRCANGYQCTFDFRSEGANRSGQVVIVLPPGYHDPENAGLRYPVLYLLHGYGMQPVELAGTGLIAATRMVSRDLPRWARPQKFIMVFPDGACRAGDGCQEGTFYVDSPSGTPRMERFFLDLMDWVDAHLRTRAAAEVEVTE